MGCKNKIALECLPTDVHQVDRCVTTDATSDRLSYVGHAHSNVAQVFNPSFVKLRLNVKNKLLTHDKHVLVSVL